MKEFIGMVEQSLRSFFKDKVNTLITLNVTGFLIIVVMFSYNFSQLDRIKRKVDHRYFNITNSLQDIHSVEIDTYKGRVVRRFEVKE